MTHLPPQRWSASAPVWARVAQGGGTALGRASASPWHSVPVAMAVRSLFAWLAFWSIYPVAASLASRLPARADGSRVAVGNHRGKSAVETPKTLDFGGLSGQAAALPRLTAKPAIVVNWALAMVALVVLPILMSVFRRLFGSQR